MTLTKDTLNELRDALAEAISTNAEADIFGTISAYGRNTVDSYPAVHVRLGGVSTEYHSTNMDKMLVTMNVTVSYLFKDETESQEAEDAIGVALSELLRILSDRKAVGGAADWLEPVAGEVTDTTIGDGTMRTALLSIQARVHVQK